MHEMSLCESLLQLLEEQAVTEQYSRVKTVFIDITPSSCIESHALKFCFDVVCKGSLAEGAQLIINKVDGQAWCFDCSTIVFVSDRFIPCPRCQGFHLKYQGDSGFKIKQLEVF
ncbi:hydrogenase maturation nickel metallochaperone HypA [Vibrio sonorensis]|uniref:hydrogenase maturation nickel metallochaperone HypA n=1 Tax=Vibrio sonorensis TaxID=1004316 RepID=UPI0008D904E7|nr:hydrogenase maturation nickel metallochaperone HypA [Vibrio sonorensis]